MFDVCRLCLDDIVKLPDEVVYDNNNVIYEAQIKSLMPEINTKITPTFTLCHQCSSSLNAAYTFKCECLRIEELLTECKKRTQSPVIDLREVKHYEESANQTNEFGGLINECQVKIEESLSEYADKTSCINEEGEVFVPHQEESSEDVREGKAEENDESLGSDRFFEETNQGNEDSESLSRRKLTNKGVKSHFCAICNKGYTRKSDLNRHEEIHRGGTYECSLCMKLFTTPRYLRQHKLYIHGIVLKTDVVRESQEVCKNYNKCKIVENGVSLLLYKCKTCNESFSKGSELKEHWKTHAKDWKFLCDVCDKPCPSRSKLEEHQCTHTNVKKHLCKVCNKGFTHRHDLKIHEDIHKDEAHKCPICGKIFKALRYLEKHKVNTHFGKYVCDTCGLKCGSKPILTEHIRVHTGERPFKCDFCGKDFAQRGTLSVHIRCTHTKEKPYVCETCGKAFSVKAALRGHKVVHQDDVDEEFPCDVEGCNKTFKTRHRLRNHKRWHVLPKDHKCAICDKGFKDAARLERHVRSHTGEKPYECDQCGKGFSQKGNLRVHFRSHRPKKRKLADC